MALQRVLSACLSSNAPLVLREPRSCLHPSGWVSSSHSLAGRETSGCLTLVSPWGECGAVSGMAGPGEQASWTRSSLKCTQVAKTKHPRDAIVGGWAERWPRRALLGARAFSHSALRSPCLAQAPKEGLQGRRGGFCYHGRPLFFRFPPGVQGAQGRSGMSETTGQ